MLIKTEGNIVDLYITGNLCSNKCHSYSFSAREGEFHSQHVVGSLWADRGGRQWGETSSCDKSHYWEGGRPSLPIRGSKGTLLAHHSWSKNYLLGSMLGPVTPRGYDISSPCALRQVGGDAVWCAPCRELPRGPQEIEEGAAITWASRKAS